MSTQYDEIGLAYESLKRLPAALLERNNFRDVVTPFLLSVRRRDDRAGSDAGASTSADEGAMVLDLACGTGYYSRLLLSWGAARVVGVDISSAMVAAAREAARAEGLASSDEGRLTFVVGDVSKPLSLSPSSSDPDAAGRGGDGGEGKFDIVVGAWLLNYAASGAEMARMFANIAAHLKPGGRFVGITPHPAEDLDALAAQYATAGARRLMQRFGVSIAYADSPLASGEGYATTITGHVEPVEISFRNFHLRREVYERAAREGGMRGGLEWKTLKLPTAEQSRSEYGVDEGFWDGYELMPHLGILVIEK